jgi:choline dehydrogenase-like flavoprotein/nucleoside-diphosphate-sugar epimerase
MPQIDLKTVPPDHSFNCDICIIGSGPAGSTVARELGKARFDVVVLESGDIERQAQVDSLNEIENVGRPRVLDQWLVRNRVVGGSSHTWTGRCAPFDEIDLERRDWVPHSGWPFAIDHVKPFLDRTPPYLGIGPGNGFGDEGLWALAGCKPPRLDWDKACLEPFFWQFSRDRSNRYDYMRFGPQLLESLAPNVSLVTNATVLQLGTNPGGTAIESVEIAAPDGGRRTLRASAVVVCAGGIENARILLCSDKTMARGLGNQNGLVGRFLMDHPRGTVASFRVKGSERLQKLFGLYNVKDPSGGHLFRHGVRLSPDLQRKEGLLNCSAWLGEVVTPDDPWNALKRFLRGEADWRKDAAMIASNAGLFARGLNDYFVERNGLPRKLDQLDLTCMCEQRPDPESRVTLSDRRDYLGQRLSRVDWRIHEQEERTVRRMAQVVCEQFSRMGIDPPVLDEWVLNDGPLPERFQDVAHPTGTTRMADDPKQGVVDAHGQVHGVHGLYVAGSSVFPTSGHANPTQMIVALAIRLADTLKVELASRETVVAPCAHAPVEKVALPEMAGLCRDQTRVLVTGASGRIGSHVIAQLSAHGYAVRALTTRPVAEMKGLVGVEWCQHDFHQSLDFGPVVAGCAAVLHLGGELRETGKMQRSNVDATRALAQASERAQVKVFCHASSVAVYGSGRKRLITEDSPTLTAQHDVRSEYWAEDYIRTYGRTKLQGEAALADEACSVEYVVLRPTVVVDVPDLIALGNWSRLKKNLAGYRHAHHIYIREVAHAFVWFMERSLERDHAEPGVSVYNLSEDDFADNTYGDFLRMAFTASGDPRFSAIKMPWPLDWCRDFMKFRSLPLRHPLGRMRFSCDKLRAVGYVPHFGIGQAYQLALEELRLQRAREARVSEERLAKER